MRLTLLVLALYLVVPVAAQSGHGSIEGLVAPLDTVRVSGYGAGTWTDAEGTRLDPERFADASPTATLIPVRAHLDPDTLETRALGSHGAFAFPSVPMGWYRLRLTAPGYQPWETDVYLPSDYPMRVSVLLRRVEE